MKNLFCAFGKKSSTVLSLILAIVVSLVGFVSLQTTALAATTVTVDNNYTWAQLKTAIETTYKGKEVVFNINRTSVLSATSLISVPAGTTVTLKCTNTAHTDPANTDICRGIDYHGSLFEIADGASLVVECCISGGADTVNGSLVYDRTSGTATLITDTTKLSTVSQKLRAGNYRYAPINYKYYGSALISVKGSLKVNNGVLKYNYNPYSPDNAKSSTNNANYNNGVYNNANVSFVNRYYETLDDGTKIGLAYYTLPCKYDGDTPVGVGGSAISVYEGGFFSITNSSLYGFTSDTGPAIGCEGVDYGTSSIVSNSKIFMNVARDVGGAVYLVANVNKPDTSNAFLTLSGSEVYYNRAQNAGGAIITGYSAVTDIKSCKIYNNVAGTYGGGLVVNAGASKAEGNTTHPLHGGKTYIESCEIYNNTAGSNGGGIATRPTPDNPNGNILQIKGTKIYNNVASGSYVSTEKNANTGFGGGLYISDYCELTISGNDYGGSDIYNNEARGGDCRVNGETVATTGRGGGIYITSTGPECSVNANIHDNVATNGSGGGIATSRTAGLNLNGSVNSNKAKEYGSGIYNFGVLKSTASLENNSGADNGGGIYNGSMGTITISGGNISENTATSYGAGISNYGTCNLNGGKISGNTVTNYGGGISNGGTLTISYSEICDNKGVYGAGVYNGSSGITTFSGGEIYNNTATKNGGGISNGGTLTIKGGKIYSNTAANGGGVLVAGSSSKLTLTAGTISKNKADFGGGIWLQSSGTITINGSTLIDGNTANSHGGGVFLDAGTLTVDGATISNNTATNNGGGIYANSDTINFKSGLIDNNTAVNGGGGGIFNYTGTAVGTINQSGGTISNNTAKWGGGINYSGNATISGGTISGNEASSGGGIAVSKPDTTDILTTSTLTLTAGKIHGNTATSNGGGINIGSSCTFTLSNGEIYNNSANYGGGIYNSGTLTVKGGKNYSNTATGYGGGIYNSGTVNITGGEISTNAGGYGAGIYNSRLGGALSLSGGNITGNTATNEGGGISTAGPVTISGGTITYNTAVKGGGVYVNGSSSVLTMTAGKVSNNTADNGGGLCFDTAGTSTISGSSLIDANQAKNGGGIYNIISQLDITGGTISNNTATEYGGGIYNSKTLTVNNAKIHFNTAEKNGGGVFNSGTFEIANTDISGNKTNGSYGGGGVYNSGTAKLVKCSFKENISAADGGGFYNSSKDTTVTDCTFTSNSAVTKGGGMYSLGNATVTGGVFTSNTSDQGGGVYCQSSLDLSNVVIEKNISTSTNENESAGGVWCGGTSGSTLTITGCTIKENEAWAGGGVHSTCNTIISDSEISYNKSTRSGSGIFVYANAEIKNSDISHNSGGHYGGGIYYLGSFADEKLTITGSTITYNSTSTEGGGICAAMSGAVVDLTGSHIDNNTSGNEGGGIYTCGTVNLYSGSINNNNAKYYGGGVYVYNYEKSIFNLYDGEINANTAKWGAGVYTKGTVNISGGAIYENESTGNGGGIYNGGTVNMTGGEIYSNIGPEGDGIYVSYGKTTCMSKDAIVKSDDEVFLSDDTFISVPTEFNYDGLSATVDCENKKPGRVIAKYGDSVDGPGVNALYWNPSNTKMSEQHFLVVDKILRSGDQGAADNYETLNYQDVFISAEYTVSFDMNPTAVILAENASLKHIVGFKEYAFDDLATNTLNKNLYHKYWNEDSSFNTGRVSYNGASKFGGWNLSKDGSGKAYGADETVDYTENKNLVFYAQWAELIDIDYNGNGATSGDNWTEEKVDANNDYTLHDGLSDDNNGAPAFERIEEGENGQNILFNFVGWSFSKNSTADEQYEFGEVVASADLKGASNVLSGRDRAVATVYAAWDRYPEIEAVDRWFTLDDAKKGKITLEELMSTAIACDGFDADGNKIYTKDDEGKTVLAWVGENTNYADNEVSGKEVFTIIDYSSADFTSFKKSGNVTVTYKAVDAIGNETYKTIIVHIVDKNQQVGDLVDRFVRFISKKFYKDDAGLAVSESNGGLNSESLWLTDDNYKTVITKALNNKKNEETGAWDFVYESWKLSIDEVKEAKSFVDEHGLGNSKEENALTVFYDKFYN